MKRRLIYLLLALLVVACAGPQAKVQTYLDQSDAIFKEMAAVGQDYGALGNDVLKMLGNETSQQKQMANLAQAAVKIKDRIQGLADRLSGIRARLAHLETPEEASVLHEHQVKALQEFDGVLQSYAAFDQEVAKGPRMNAKMIASLSKIQEEKFKASQAETNLATQERARLIREFGLRP